MTSNPTTTSPDAARLRDGIRLRAERGDATVDDWRALAEADPALARRELAAYLKTDGDRNNPYRRSENGLSVVIGMVVGAALMVVVWIVMPMLYEHWKATDSPLSGLGTFGMLGASLLPFGCAYLAWRWSRSRGPVEADLETLLRRLELPRVPRS